MIYAQLCKNLNRIKMKWSVCRRREERFFSLFPLLSVHARSRDSNLLKRYTIAYVCSNATSGNVLSRFFFSAILYLHRQAHCTHSLRCDQKLTRINLPICSTIRNEQRALVWHKWCADCADNTLLMYNSTMMYGINRTEHRKLCLNIFKTSCRTGIFIAVERLVAVMRYSNI